MRRETSLSSQVAVDNSNNYKFCIHSDFVVVNSCGYFIARKRYKRSTNIEIHTIHKINLIHTKLTIHIIYTIDTIDKIEIINTKYTIYTIVTPVYIIYLYNFI